MRIIQKISLKIRRIKKIFIIRKATKRIGGETARKLFRNQRQESIYRQKKLMRSDLMNSWRIGEIKSPDKGDWESIDIPPKNIPISHFIYLKKKYWGGNIYNEL
jgi:hypothetical protein